MDLMEGKHGPDAPVEPAAPKAIRVPQPLVSLACLVVIIGFCASSGRFVPGSGAAIFTRSRQPAASPLHQQQQPRLAFGSHKGGPLRSPRGFAQINSAPALVRTLKPTGCTTVGIVSFCFKRLFVCSLARCLAVCLPVSLFFSLPLLGRSLRAIWTNKDP